MDQTTQDRHPKEQPTLTSSGAVMQLELLVIRYIDPSLTDGFSNQLSKLGVGSLNDESRPSQPASHSTSPTLWDYPSFSESVHNTEDVISACHHAAQKEPTTSSLYEMRLLTVESPPSHYPYRYVASFHFRIPELALPKQKGELLNYLLGATEEAKAYTNELTLGAKYRPVYWFISGAPAEMRGLRGTIEKVKAPDAATEIEVERGFPHASYIIYDILPSDKDLRLADLALVSVVPHVVERGFRPELVDKNERIEKLLNTLDSASSTALTSASQLREHLGVVENAQREIRADAYAFHQTRRNLIRLRGLVQRVRQLGGNATDRTLYDIVCEDAITQIEDEVTMSEEQIESGIESVSDRVAIIHSQINNRYSMLTANRTRRLQRIAVMLQSTGIAFVIFQVLEKLWNVPETSTLPADASCCWAVEPARLLRAFVLVAVAIIAFFVSKGLLRRNISTQKTTSNHATK